MVVSMLGAAFWVWRRSGWLLSTQATTVQSRCMAIPEVLRQWRAAVMQIVQPSEPIHTMLCAYFPCRTCISSEEHVRSPSCQRHVALPPYQAIHPLLPNHATSPRLYQAVIQGQG